jgi:hypothetical protein
MDPTSSEAILWSSDIAAIAGLVAFVGIWDGKFGPLSSA